ncbi:autotransporter domain-containing protein [Novosphingobium sp.]|uniref:autotransporter outer membrane beta-barrel domain-containing protein n=1 Tax=Novosphingobium sp. TaxID=1874826 RepID=UPI0025EB66E5|nr:autotransporter outer membrane beta-barrel domain-containing protein [Novosphingobium sp.]
MVHRSNRALRPAGFVRPAFLGAASVLALCAAPAWAQCVPDSSGDNVTCSGTSPAYSNTAAGVTLNAQSGGTVTGPVVLGDGANVGNAGTVNGPAGSPTIQAGNTATITNAGTIAQANATAGSSGILLGDNGTVINSGTLTAPSGTNVVSFGRGGSFTLASGAPAVVTGNVVFDNNIVFGTNVGPSVASFVNQNTAFGFAGNVSSIGNTTIDNAGPYTGNFTQTQSGSTVNFLNEATGVFTGTIQTGDPIGLTNNGTMTLVGLSSLQSAATGAPASVVTNTGTLNVGTATVAGQLNINGNFIQSTSGTLGLTLRSSAAPVAGTTFSQVFATGSAQLAGTLNLNVTPGYYPSGSTYNVVVGNGGLSGGFSAVTGNGLTFISFVPVGVVTVSGTQQAYQIQAVRTTTYAAAIAAVATPAELAIATGYQGVVSAADLAPAGAAATLVGQTDVLTVAQAQAFFDSVNPAGYLGYANAMRDQANLFQRQVALRMTDQNSSHPEDGFWMQAGGSLFGKAARGTSNSRETGYQIDFGYDISGPKYVLGAAFSYSQDHLTYGLGNLVGHNNAYIFGGYGAFHLGPLVASGQVSYQLGNFAANKVVTAGATTYTASAHAADRLLTANATLGGELKAAGLSVTPFVGIAKQVGSISAFSEINAGAADLSVGRIRANRTDLLAGATVTKAEGGLRPYLRATYRSQIGTGPDAGVTAYFNGDPTTTFTVAGQPAAKHQGDVDAGVNIVVNDEGGFFVGYQGTFRSDLTSHGLVAGVRLEF